PRCPTTPTRGPSRPTRTKPRAAALRRTCWRSRTLISCCSLAEAVHDAQHGRSHDRDEQGREDAEDQRDGDLHGNLLGLLFGPLTPLDSHFRGLYPQDLRNGDAEG